MTRFASHQQPTQGPCLVANAFARRVVAAAGQLAAGKCAEVGPVALARVVDGVAGLTERGEEGLDVGDDGSHRGDGKAGSVCVAPWCADYEKKKEKRLID